MNRFGLSQSQWLMIKNLILDQLDKYGCRAYVFGSRARNDHQMYSDLDILIEGPLPKTTLSKIQQDLEDSNLTIKVDLVMADDLAESYRENVYRDRILADQG